MKTKIEKIQRSIMFGVAVLIISSLCLLLIVQPTLNDMQKERDERYGEFLAVYHGAYGKKVLVLSSDVYEALLEEFESTGEFLWEPTWVKAWPEWKERDYQTLVAIRILNILFIIAGTAVLALGTIQCLFEIRLKQKQPNQQRQSQQYQQPYQQPYQPPQQEQPPPPGYQPPQQPPY